MEKRNEKIYRDIINASIDGFWYVDSVNGRFLDINGAACRMLGYARSELLKMRIADIEVIEKPADVKKHMQYMEKHGGDRFETKHRRKDGRIIDIEISTNCIKDESGRGRIFVFAHDISERKKAERHKQELIRNLSHELKTPIAMSEMSLDMLDEAIRSADENKIKRSRKIFFDSLLRLKKDVNNVTKLFSLRTGYMPQNVKKCSIRDVLHDVLESLDYAVKEKGLKLLVDIKKRAGHIYINENIIRTMLFNVLDNAVKFTEKGTITVRSAKKDGYIKVTVKDTGMGIKPEDIPMLFEPFYKANPSFAGAGVGLVICRDIARAHGGDIRVDSEGHGNGTTVMFKLPLRAKSKREGETV